MRVLEQILNKVGKRKNAIRSACALSVLIASSLLGQPASALTVPVLKNKASPVLPINFSVGEITAGTSHKAPVFVKLPDEVKDAEDDGSMWVRVIGLPSKLRFSKGSSITGIWIVKLRDIPELLIISPDGYKGNFNLDFFLMQDGDEGVEIHSKTTVKVSFAGQADELTRVDRKKVAAHTQAEIKRPVEQKQAPQKKTDRETKLERLLLKRAAKLVELGLYTPARIVYEELAEQGSARAAFELAKTYDPDITKSKPISGMAPDRALARKWYKKAKELEGRK